MKKQIKQGDNGGADWKRLRQAANLFLLFLAALQGAAVFFILSGQTLRLPDFAKNFIGEKLREKGVDLKADEILFNLHGQLLIKDLSLRFEGSVEEFFKAEEVSVKPQKNKLFSGILELKELFVKNAAAGFTTSNVNTEPVVGGINLLLSDKNGAIKIHYARANLGNLEIRAHANLSKNFDFENCIKHLLPPKERETPQKTDAVRGAGKRNPPAQIWDETCLKIKSVSAQFGRFENPRIDLDAQISKDKIEHAVFAFSSQEAFYESENGMSAESAETRAVAVLKDSAKLERLVFRLRAKSIKLSAKKESVNIENPEIAAIIDLSKFDGKNPETLGAFNAALAASAIKSQHGQIENAVLRKDVLSSGNFIDGAQLFFKYEGGSFEADLEGTPENLSVKFDAAINARSVLKNKFFTDIHELGGTNFNSPVFLSGSAAIRPDRKSVSANAELFAQDCSFLGIPVEELSGRLSFDSDAGEFTALNVAIKTREGWTIGGDVYQNLKTNRYTFALNGQIMPMKIAHIMAPWWTRVFRMVEFSNPAPQADVFVEGTWGKPDYIWCFAKAGGENAVCHGSRFKKFTTYVLVNPRIIALLDAKIENGESRADFDMQWLYGQKGLTRFEKNTLKGDFILTQKEIVSLAGDEVEDVFKTVSFAKRPSAKLNALMFNPHFKNAPKNIYEARINSGGKMCLDAIDFNDAAFTAIAQGSLIEISGIKAQTCGGEIVGTAFVSDANDKKNADIQMDLHCKNLFLGEFINTLSDLGKPREQILSEDAEDARKRVLPQGARAEKSSFAGAENALLSGKMYLAGPLFDASGLEGKGKATIESPELGKLNLLGAISRTLGAFSSGLGSFDVTKASANCAISQGYVHFDNLEISGPKIKITGLAKYQFMKDDIGAKLLISPFGSMETPIISRVFTALDPFLSAFEVTLSGRFEDPKIGVALRPMNIFNSDDGLLKNFRREIAAPEIIKEAEYLLEDGKAGGNTSAANPKPDAKTAK